MLRPGLVGTGPCVDMIAQMHCNDELCDDNHVMMMKIMPMKVLMFNLCQASSSRTYTHKKLASLKATLAQNFAQ